jgi:hypothetical protein
MVVAPIVSVIWKDHAIHPQWPVGRSYIEFETIGWLVEETPELVAIALSRDTLTGEFADVQVVLRPLLVSLKRRRNVR